MNVLIIGGTGLISTAITQECLRRGYDVTLYNRGTTPSRFEGEVGYIVGDRYDFDTFEHQMSETDRFDCVIDMLSFTAEHAQSSVRAFKHRVGQMIFCSTIAVYSNPAHRYPLTEDEPRQGNNDYGRGKILAEDVYTQAHQNNDFPVTIIRPGYSYGEGGQLVEPFGWGTRYIDRLRKQKPLVLHADGVSFWSACHVDDMARAFVNAIGNRTTFGQVYHVNGEEWLTWNRYYQELAEAINAPQPNLIYIPTDLLHRLMPDQADVIATDFIGHRIYDNTKARRDLDFRYTITWKQGAKRTVDWLDKHHQIENSDDDPIYQRLISMWQSFTDNLVEEWNRQS